MTIHRHRKARATAKIKAILQECLIAPAVVPQHRCTLSCRILQGTGAKMVNSIYRNVLFSQNVFFLISFCLLQYLANVPKAKPREEMKVDGKRIENDVTPKRFQNRIQTKTIFRNERYTRTSNTFLGLILFLKQRLMKHRLLLR